VIGSSEKQSLSWSHSFAVAANSEVTPLQSQKNRHAWSLTSPDHPINQDA